MIDVQLAERLEAAYLKHFPNGWITVYASRLGTTTHHVSFGILRRDAFPNGIAENDPGYMQLVVDGEELRLNSVLGSSLRIKPPAGSHLAFGSLKVPFRKSKKDPVAAAEKFFAKLRKIVEENLDNLVDGHREGLGI
jgi:hypothetical protein